MLVFLDAVVGALSGQILALIALIVVNLLLAIAVAILTGRFDLGKLTDFYIRQVIPYLIGWLALTILARFTTSDVLGPVYGPIAGDTVAWAGWLAVVAVIGKKIVENAKSLWGNMLPFKVNQPVESQTEQPVEPVSAAQVIAQSQRRTKTPAVDDGQTSHR